MDDTLDTLGKTVAGALTWKEIVQGSGQRVHEA
jgi:hypothetical protein